jgi:PHS family inorganic phosphate transporter-like MFS transporter
LYSEGGRGYQRGISADSILILQGTLTGSVVTIIILACFSKALLRGDYNELDAVWRIQMGLALVPAFATLWPRLTMPEGRKYIESQELNTLSSSNSSVYKGATVSSEATKESQFNSLDLPRPSSSNAPSSIDPSSPTIANNLESVTARKARYSTFFIYFSEWRHLKTLFGTASCWFLLDVAFYGTNLNQSVLLTEIGFSTGKNEYDLLMRNAIGNLIIAVAGYVPGYFFTIYFIEKLGRRWIQIQGFLVAALMFGILAGDYAHLGTAGKFVCFAIAQVN